MHDPCAVAYVIDPTIVRAVKMPIAIETTGTHTLGMTVADLRAPAPEDCRTSAAMELDHERFWDLVVDALERIGETPDTGWTPRSAATAVERGTTTTPEH